ncbi:hypothetical protein ACOZ4I_19385 (plasmid) [Haloarcula salina]|uniref:hypothetical protein n=1 Tax=Haloarcula salina TaxID=1429914 RepID=UPI003C6FFDE3
MVEQSLDRVAFRFITTDGCDCDNEWLGSTKDESSEVAMALRGPIAGFRVAEFTSVSVWTAVVVDVDEVESDDPRAGAEDHRRLFDEKIVDDDFEVIRWDGMKLCERVVVRIRSTSGIGDGLDRLLINGGLEKCLPDNPGVEGCGFDSGDWYLCEKSRG